MEFIIHRASGGTINLLNKSPNALSTVTQGSQKISLLAEDIVLLTVESSVKIPFEIGDRMNVFGRVYRMNRLPRMQKNGNRLFSYDIEMEGIQYDLMRASYDLTIDTTNNQLQDVQADSLTGNLHRFLSVLISNANRVFPDKWVLGECPDTGDKTLAFGESDNCLAVLQRLCQEFDTEFEIGQSGGVNTISLKKVGQIFPYTFRYGKGNGLYSLERQNVSSANIITRLKVYGASKNITHKYRAHRLCLPGKNKGDSYIEKPEAVAQFGVWEATKYFEDEFPKQKGTVTGVFTDSVLKFTDLAMSFDLNEKEADGKTTKYLIAGTPAKVHFNSGNLSGYEFEVSEYDHASKTFTLREYKDDRGEIFPSQTSAAFQFSVGDEYKLLDIAMPQSIIDASDSQAYYIYAKCQRSGTGGSIIFSKAQIKVDQDPSYYLFWVGIVNSVDLELNSRSLALMYGFTMINGRFISTGRIQSADGDTYFDLDEGVINGNIRIQAGSSGYNNLSDKPNLSIYKTKAEFNVFANQISGRVSQINTRLGGTEAGLQNLNTWTQQQINAVNQKVTPYALQQAGFITKAQGNTLYASAQDMNGNRLVSLITQTPSAINLLSRNINLSGNVTFTNYQSYVNNSLNQKQGKNDTFDMNKARLNGKTIIEGGLIKASLINTRNLVVSGGARIGSFRIQDGKLKTYYAPPSEGESWNWARFTDTELSHRLVISGMHTKNEMTVSEHGIHLIHSGGGAQRDFSVTIENTGDASWYKRVLIRASILPHKNGVHRISKIANAISNTTQFWEVLWDARSGCFCLGKQY